MKTAAFVLRHVYLPKKIDRALVSRASVENKSIQEIIAEILINEIQKEQTKKSE